MTTTRGWGLLEKTLSCWRFSTVLSLLKRKATTGRILDLGCGPRAHFLPRTVFQSKFGIDLFLTFHGGSFPRDKDMRLLCADLQRSDPPFRACSFEAITAIAFLEHLPGRRGGELLRSVYELLKPGGILLLTTPAQWTRAILKAMALLRLVSPAEIADHKMYYTRDSIATALIQAGFSCSSIQVGQFMAGANYWALAQKK